MEKPQCIFKNVWNVLFRPTQYQRTIGIGFGRHGGRHVARWKNGARPFVGCRSCCRRILLWWNQPEAISPLRPHYPIFGPGLGSLASGTRASLQTLHAMRNGALAWGAPFLIYWSLYSTYDCACGLYDASGQMTQVGDFFKHPLSTYTTCFAGVYAPPRPKPTNSIPLD